MFVNVAYMDNILESYLTPMDYEDYSVPLKIVCCGFYRLTDTDSVVDTFRPDGRKDYQLLYFHSGRGHFSFSREDTSSEKCPTVVSAGEFVLFYPGDRQVYEYYSTDHTQVYWIHFTGNEAEALLEQFGFMRGQHIYWGGVSLEYQSLFRKMIKEMQLCQKNYETVLESQLKQLLALTDRNRHNPYIIGSAAESMVNDAIVYFDENYAKPININDYAGSLYVSPCWFIRSFRNYVGITPLQYIINVKMSNARDLLLNPAFSVSDAAQSVGYEDPLYFSRTFKKNVGISPKDYKKRFQVKEHAGASSPDSVNSPY